MNKVILIMLSVFLLGCASTVDVKDSSMLAYDYYKRGAAYHIQGQYDKAISDYSKTIDLNPMYSFAYYDRGKIFDNQGQYDKALSNYNKSKCITLNQFPDRGRIVPELKAYGILSYRELIISPWRVIYRTSDQKVYVLAVIDSRRTMDDILLERFL